MCATYNCLKTVLSMLRNTCFSASTATREFQQFTSIIRKLFIGFLAQVAEEMDDPQMTDYIEGTFLEDQVKAVREVSEYVRQLRRVGKGHGEFKTF